MHLEKFARSLVISGWCAALLSPLAAAPWKFAVMGDGRTGGENNNTTGVHDDVARALANEAVQQGVRLVVFSGDLANGNIKFGPIQQQFANWKKAMAPLYDAKIPVYVVRGNHDTSPAQDNPKGSVLAAWREAFPLPQNGPGGEEGLTYRVDYENAPFIAVDQFIGKKPGFDGKRYTGNTGMISPWVLTQIKDASARWVFVFGHEAAFIGHHKDCLANVSEERDALWDALGEKGGVYLAGHDHMYVRQTAPDRAGHPVLTLVVGDAGAPSQLYDNSGFNAKVGRGVVPQNFFVNAKVDTGENVPDDDAAKAKSGKSAKAEEKGFGPKVENTNGLPMYFGYVLVTVDGDHLSGEWRAFVNYDSKASKGPVPPEAPKFETLDRFSWPAK